MIKRIISLTMAITAVCAVFCSAFNVCATDTDLTVTLASVKEVEELSYGEYSLKYADMPQSKNTYSAAISEEAPVISTEENEVSVQIDVLESGLYNLEVEYKPLEGGLSPIERRLYINGSQPFKELENIRFERCFKNATEIMLDKQGNDMIPDQQEVISVSKKRISDISGYYNNPYAFYLEKGINTITFVGMQENFSILAVRACPVKNPPSYSELEKIYKEKGYKNAEKSLPLINAENANLKSTYTLVPTTDRSSPSTVPYSPSKNKLNTIGGEGWSTPGMWLEWTVEVDESALYQIDFRYKQNFAKGVSVKRKLYIDGEVPFAEAQGLTFDYGRSWSFCDNGYLYYLEKGTHTIRLEAVLGDMGDVLMESEDFQYTLNALYREIIMVTGTSPDIYRSYKIEQRIENLGQRLNELAKRSKKIIKRTEEIFGSSNSISVSLEAFALQLEEIAEEPEKITTLLSLAKEAGVNMLRVWGGGIFEKPHFYGRNHIFDERNTFGTGLYTA